MDKQERKLLFSVTAKDCQWDFIRGSGAGGQKRNKTSSAVRCTHIKSGAIGYSEEQRSQRQNRESAFERMANTPKFKTWIRLEVSRITGKEKDIERTIDKAMRQIKVEVKKEGKWAEVPKDELLPDGVD